MSSKKGKGARKASKTSVLRAKGEFVSGGQRWPSAPSDCQKLTSRRVGGTEFQSCHSGESLMWYVPSGCMQRGKRAREGNLICTCSEKKKIKMGKVLIILPP